MQVDLSLQTVHCKETYIFLSRINFVFVTICVEVSIHAYLLSVIIVLFFVHVFALFILSFVYLYL